MFKRFIFRLLVNALAFWLSSVLLSGVSFGGSWWVIALAVVVFSFVNTFIKPVVTILSLPAIIFSLGLFYLVVNGLMLWLVSALVPGFQLAGLWTAIGMGLIVSLTNWFFHLLFEHKKD
jgi:putative membrane protein